MSKNNSNLTMSERYVQSTKQLTSELFKEIFVKFQNSFPIIVGEIVSDPQYSEMGMVNKHLEDCLNYTSRKSYPRIGLLCAVTVHNLLTAKAIKADGKIFENGIIVGWCVELLYDALKITEDFVQNKTQRNGKPTWHMMADVGSMAFNDTLLITGGVFNVIKRHFGDEPFYGKIMSAFKDSQFKRSLGNILIQNSKNDGTNLNWDRYDRIVTNTVDMEIWLPVNIALMITNQPIEMGGKMNSVCIKVGRLRILMNELEVLESTSQSGKKLAWSVNAIVGDCNVQERTTMLNAVSETGMVKDVEIFNTYISRFDIITRLRKTIEDLHKEIHAEVSCGRLEFPEMENVMEVLNYLLLRN